MKNLKSAKVGDLVCVVDASGSKTKTIRRVTKTRICVGPFRGRTMNGLISYNRNTGIMVGCLKQNQSIAFVPEHITDNGIQDISILNLVKKVYKTL